MAGEPGAGEQAAGHGDRLVGDEETSGQHGRAGGQEPYRPVAGAGAGAVGEQEHGPQLLGYGDVGQAEPAEQAEVGMGQDPAGDQAEPERLTVEGVGDTESGGEHQKPEGQAQAQHHGAFAPGRQRTGQVPHRQRDPAEGGGTAGADGAGVAGGEAEREGPHRGDEQGGGGIGGACRAQGPGGDDGTNWCSAPSTAVERNASIPRCTAATTSGSLGATTAVEATTARATPKPTSPAPAAARKPRGTPAAAPTAARPSPGLDRRVAPPHRCAPRSYLGLEHDAPVAGVESLG